MKRGKREINLRKFEEISRKMLIFLWLNISGCISFMGYSDLSI